MAPEQLQETEFDETLNSLLDTPVNKRTANELVRAFSRDSRFSHEEQERMQCKLGYARALRFGGTIHAPPEVLRKVLLISSRQDQAQSVIKHTRRFLRKARDIAFALPRAVLHLRAHTSEELI